MQINEDLTKEARAGARDELKSPMPFSSLTEEQQGKLVSFIREDPILVEEFIKRGLGAVSQTHVASLLSQATNAR